MFDPSRPLRSAVAALAFALLLSAARPAAACDADEEPCGQGCVPAGNTCCGSDDTFVYYCLGGGVCLDGGGCEDGTGPSSAQLIIEANGAPYGASLPRSCALGGGGGDGGCGALAFLFALGALARRRRYRSTSRRPHLALVVSREHVMGLSGDANRREPTPGGT